MTRKFALSFAVGLALVSAACDALPGKPKAADRPILATQIADFNVLYAQNCSGCHGATGRNGAARPLNDPLYLAMVDAEFLRRIISQGLPGTAMPAWAVTNGGNLTDVQVALLAREMLTRWGHPEQFTGTALPPYSAPGPGDVQRGATAYATFCARCHGPDGREGAGGSIVDPAYLALVSNQALRTAVIAGRPDLGKPDWRSNVPGRPMSDQEITDVVAWVAAQRAG